MISAGGLDKYFVPVAAKTLDILEAFRHSQEELTLKQVIQRTGVAHTTAFRILQTLVQKGYLRLGDSGKVYRLNRGRQKTRIGFATLTNDTSFARAITRSLEAAARDAGMDLIVLSNERKAEAAIANAKKMVAEGIGLAIEFQRNEHVAPVIADIFASAGIPTIAVLVPQPGAIYFGVNNYRAGVTAGEALAEHARSHWNGQADLLVLLDLPVAGAVVQSRMTGVARGVEERLGASGPKVARVDGKGTREESARATALALRQNAGARRILVSAVTDESGLGAMDALREAGLASSSAVVGHGGSYEVLREIVDPASPYIGTVAFFPEQYGRGLVELVLRLLHGYQVPPYRYMEHALISRENAESHRGLDDSSLGGPDVI